MHVQKHLPFVGRNEKLLSSCALNLEDVKLTSMIILILIVDKL